MLGQIKLVLFFLFLSSIGGVIWYVQHLQAENEILTLNNEKLNGAVEQQQALIEQQLRDIESKTAINEQLAKNNLKLSADLNLANEKFNKVNASGDRRDIGALSVNRPKSIERILNCQSSFK